MPNEDSTRKAQSNDYEELLSQKGSRAIQDLYKLDMHVFGKSKKYYGEIEREDAFTVEAVVLRINPSDTTRFRGLKLGIGTLYSGYPNSAEYPIAKSFVSMGEIPSLIAAVDTVIVLSALWKETGRVNTQVVYKTSEGLELHLDQKGKEQRLYLRLQQLAEKSYTNLHSVEDLTIIKQLLEKGYNKLVGL